MEEIKGVVIAQCNSPGAGRGAVWSTVLGCRSGDLRTGEAENSLNGLGSTVFVLELTRLWLDDSIFCY